VFSGPGASLEALGLRCKEPKGKKEAQGPRTDCNFEFARPESRFLRQNLKVRVQPFPHLDFGGLFVCFEPINLTARVPPLVPVKKKGIGGTICNS
jgi:hypothetical protein